MDTQNCSGIDPATGAPVGVRFGSRITAVEPLEASSGATAFVSSGWIDIQVNGFARVDYCSPTSVPDEIARSIRAIWATGVTRLFPTVITGPPEGMAGAIGRLARAKRELRHEGRSIAGIHVEGPHISPEDEPRGAHPREWVRPPDIEELRKWMDVSEGNLKLVTLAPEWPGATGYIEAACREGVTVSLGHTAATPEQISDAVNAGATLSTHLGNAGPKTMARHPNYLWEQLSEDRLCASFIVDGFHLPRSFLLAAVRAKGAGRSVLITDAVMAAGCAPGRYRMGGVEVELHADGHITVAGRDRLAGSALTMERAIANVLGSTGCSVGEAVAMATVNPARVCRIEGRQRGLMEGERADLVQFQIDPGTRRVMVSRVWIDGEEAFRR